MRAPGAGDAAPTTRPFDAVLALGLEVAALWGVWRAVRALADLMGAETGRVWAFLAVALAIGLWALWAAPRARARLTGTALLAFKAAFFLVAALAWGVADGALAGLAMLALATFHLSRAWRSGSL